MRRKWTPEADQKLMALFRQGVKLRIIAGLLGTTRNAVSCRLHRIHGHRFPSDARGRQANQKRMRAKAMRVAEALREMALIPDRDQAIRWARKHGVTQSAIGSVFKISKQRVWQIERRA